MESKCFHFDDDRKMKVKVTREYIFLSGKKCYPPLAMILI